MLVLLGLRQEKMSGNLFELRKDWPIPPANNILTATNPKLPIKIEPQEPDQPPPMQQHHQNQANAEGDQTVPFARMQKKIGMVSDQKQLQETNTNTQTQDTQQKNSFQTQNMKQIQAQYPQHTQDYQVPQNLQHTCTQSFGALDRYAEQIHLRREWKEKMERLNEKYGLDYFSDSELDSELDEGENYRYVHKYKTFI